MTEIKLPLSWCVDRVMISMNLGKKFNNCRKKKRASPFIEEGILIIFGLFVFLIILGSINQILDWFISFSSQLFEDLKSKIPL